MKSERQLSNWELLCDILLVAMVWLIAVALVYLVIVKINLLSGGIGISK